MHCQRCGESVEGEPGQDAIAVLGGVCFDCFIRQRLAERVQQEADRDAAEWERVVLYGDGSTPQPRGFLNA